MGKLKHGVTKCIHESVLKTDLGSSDTLIVVCDIFLPGPDKVLSGAEDLEGLEGVGLLRNKALQELSNDFKAFDFCDSSFGDIVVSCNFSTFFCHEDILAARSPVFRAMFETDMKESSQRHVEVKDIDPKVFHELLVFIYSGAAPKLSRYAEELLPAADKYQLELLKQMCERSLSCSLNTHNCAHLLLLADRHRAQELEGRALLYMRRNKRVKLEGCKDHLGQDLQVKVEEAINSGDYSIS